MKLTRLLMVIPMLALAACKTIETKPKNALTFAKAAQKTPKLAPYFLAAQASAELDHKNYQQASKLAESMLTSPTGLPKIVLTRLKKVAAELALIEHNDAAIIATHTALLADGYEHEEIVWQLAQALSRANQHQKAQGMYKRLMINFPASKQAQAAEEQVSLASLGLDSKELEKRFDRLIEKMAFQKVALEVDYVLNNTDLPAAQKSDLAAIAVKAFVYDNQFSEALARSAERAQRNDALPKDLETHAFALAKAGHALEAADFYQRMDSLSDDPEEKAKACFFRGFSLYEVSLYTDALVAWQSCSASITSSSFYENHLWYQAYSLIVLGLYNQALGVLTTMKQRFIASPELEKYAYFLSYCLEHLNKNQESTHELMKLANKKEPSYYVQRARHKLALANHNNEALAATVLRKRAAHIHHHDAHLAKTLFAEGLPDEAQDLIMRSSMTTLDKMSMLQHLELYDAAFRLSRSSISLEQGRLKAAEQARASYPYPYADIMAEVSMRYGQNPHLLYAIMRTESSFKKTAMSPRGALGLMQIMPHVAADLAPHSGNTSLTSDALINPRTSLELGALLMAMLRRQFDADHLAIASYNAGAHIVNQWQNLFGHLPIELFIERIPYKQTRDYVKKVAFTESIYHGLSGQPLRLLF